MQTYKGTGCQIILIGTLKSMPKYDRNSQSYIAVLETRKPYFDNERQFLQEDISWFQIILSEENAKLICKHATINLPIAVTGDFSHQDYKNTMDYTATMLAIDVTQIEFMTGTHEENTHTRKHKNNMRECLLH